MFVHHQDTVISLAMATKPEASESCSLEEQGTQAMSWVAHQSGNADDGLVISAQPIGLLIGIHCLNSLALMQINFSVVLYLRRLPPSPAFIALYRCCGKRSLAYLNVKS